MTIDLKFLSTFIAAVAGVLVPVWLWQADLDSKGLSLRVVSSTSLSSGEVGSISGMAVTLDGKSVEVPYISTLEIRSSGRRAIAASDFEGSIEILASAPALLVKAEIKDATPPDLRPAVEAKSGSVFVKPLLLNADDRFQVTVVSAGAKPNFSARSRISGVSQVTVVDATSDRLARRTWLQRAIGVSLIAVYFPLALPAIASFRHRPVRLSRLFAAVTTLTGGILLSIIPVSAADVRPIDGLPMVAVGVVLGTLLLAIQRRYPSAA